MRESRSEFQIRSGGVFRVPPHPVLSRREGDLVSAIRKTFRLFLPQSIKRLPVQAEGAGGRGLVALATANHFLDDVPLDVAEVSRKRDGNRVAVASRPLRWAAVDCPAVDLLAVAQGHGMGDHAGQLDQVAGPVVVQQAFPCLLGETPRDRPGPDVLLGERFPQKMLRQRFDVLAASRSGGTRTEATFKR